MDREGLMLVLFLAASGPGAWIVSGLAPLCGDSDSARQSETRHWRRLWLPLWPVLLGAGLFGGWAVQEMEPTDEVPSWPLVVAASFVAIVWARALIRGAFALRVSRHSTPISTIGLFQPRVVVSPEFAASVDEEVLASAVAHEQAHAAHFDPLRIWLGQLATDLQWPAPRAANAFTHWLHWLELARDEEARALGADGAALADAVLAASRHRRGPARAVALLAPPGAPRLRHRIEWLLQPLRAAPPVRRGTFALACVIATSLALATVGGIFLGEPLVDAFPGIQR